jgi:hypothetical protein
MQGSKAPGHERLPRRPASKRQRQAPAGRNRQRNRLPGRSQSKKQRADVYFSGQRPKSGHDSAKRRTNFFEHVIGQLLTPGGVAAFPLLQRDAARGLFCHV